MQAIVAPVAHPRQSSPTAQPDHTGCNMLQYAGKNNYLRTKLELVTIERKEGTSSHVQLHKQLNK